MHRLPFVLCVLLLASCAVRLGFDATLDPEPASDGAIGGDEPTGAGDLDSGDFGDSGSGDPGSGDSGPGDSGPGDPGPGGDLTPGDTAQGDARRDPLAALRPDLRLALSFEPGDWGPGGEVYDRSPLLNHG